MTLSKELEESLQRAYDFTRSKRHEYVSLEHLLYSLTDDTQARDLLSNLGVDIDSLRAELMQFIEETFEKLPEDLEDYEPSYTLGTQFVLRFAAMHVQSSGKEEVNAQNIIAAMFRQDESHAVYLLNQQGVSRYDVVRYISHGVGKTNNEGGAPTVEEGQAKDPLEEFCTDLNAKVKAGKIDPIIGREQEIERTVHILARRRKNNPVFVGEAGVGKTAIAEGLAYKIVNDDVPEALKDITIYALNMGFLVSGTRYRGDFEERLKAVVDKVKDDHSKVLFIDEIHTMVGAGSASGSALDASNMLKPALASGEIRCIGTTTTKEYRSVFEKDHALSRRFQKIVVHEPSENEAIQILKGIKKYYEEFHKVTYSKKALEAAVELSAKHITDRKLPDKAIDILDEAGAEAKLKGFAQVSVRHIENLVSRIAKVPARTVQTDDREKLYNLEDELKKVIFGQNDAIETVVQAVQMSRAGLNDPQKPIGSFIFAGPTGVGKTELAKQLAEALGTHFLRLAMREYMEKPTVSRLIGSPPGYVGFDQGGQLTEAVAANPHAVLLLDEIEKAHEDIYNILLQVMDHATLTDTNGREVDFKQVILIMTSNTGARESLRLAMGFDRKQKEDRSKEAIERYFSPEFRNRLSAIVRFNSLEQSMIIKVVDKVVAQLAERLSAKNIKIELTQKAKEYLADAGYDEALGARPIQRMVDKEITRKLTQEMLFGKLQKGGKVVVDADDDGLLLNFSD